MLNVFVLVLLLVYFWYFYHSDSKALSPPKLTRVEPAEAFQVTYYRIGPHEFEFYVNGNFVWNQTISSYSVTDHNIQEIDECHQTIQNGQKIPAKGVGLYHFVKKYPKFQSLVNAYHTDDNGLIFRHGTPFYFTCEEKKIAALTLCPSGSIFTSGTCRPISSCTGRVDGTRLPHPDPHQWIECQDGGERVRKCAPGEVFYGGHCAKEKERLCVLQRELAFFKLDEKTLFGCQNHTPVYRTCPKGTRLFDSTVCEPDDCFGKPDGERIALPSRKKAPFEYIPGYWVCRQGKVDETVQCPQVWDSMLATQENLTMLPMVFDTQRNECSIPAFCKNVFPTEDNIHVRSHKYTRELQNWSYSRFYDQGAGYICENNTTLKQIDTPGDKRINDHFKVVPACNENDPSHLPIYNKMDTYYDCNQQAHAQCQNGEFFNGSTCVQRPEGIVFKYNSYLPIFEFDSLNSEGWIPPFTKRTGEPDLQCENGYKFLKMYHICSVPLCTRFAFLSTIPELSLFLPPEEKKAKCTFDEIKRHLRLVDTTLHYTFWDQKVRHEREIITEKERECTFSKQLQTGNFIWDRTVYATCDPQLPFVFCPSAHTRQIYGNSYACYPPTTKTLRHDSVDFTSYTMNEFRRILPVSTQDTFIQLNKGSPRILLPPTGIDIPDNMRLNLQSSQAVDLEYKYRVTYPPHIVFEYTGNNKPDIKMAMDTSDPNNIQVDFSKAFNVKTQQFETGKFKFPRHRLKFFLPGLYDRYDP